MPVKEERSALELARMKSSLASKAAVGELRAVAQPAGSTQALLRYRWAGDADAKSLSDLKVKLLRAALPDDSTQRDVAGGRTESGRRPRR